MSRNHRHAIISGPRSVLFIAALLALQPARAQTWDTVANGLNGNVFGMFVPPGNTLYVCGAFQFADTIPMNRVTAWDGNAFSPLADGLDQFTYAFAAFNGDLFAGGNFNYSGFNPMNYIARWDGTAWNDVGGGTDNQVYYLATYNNELYAGGAFDTAGGVAASRIARWNGTAWSAVGAGITGEVYSMAEYNGSLYVAGAFTAAGGVPVNNIARWDGNTWSDVGGGATGGPGFVNDLYVFSGNLYAVGGFAAIGGVSASGIGRWDGSNWSSIGAGFAGGGGYGAVLYDYQGELYTGGNFTSVDGVPALNIARWDGSQWQALTTGCNQEVDALEVFNNVLYVGGAFSTAGGLSATRIARWTMPCNTAVTAGATAESCAGACDGTVTATPSGQPPFTYLWSTGDTTATVTALCAGVYTVAITDSAGCNATDSVEVTGLPAPALALAAADPTCNGLCNGAAVVAATGSGPFTYAWNTVPPQAGDTATQLCAGTWTVTVTDTAGCATVDSVTLSDPAYTLAVTGQNTSCPSTCDGMALAVFSSPHGPLTYSWNTVPPQAGSLATALCSGTWTVTATDTNQCSLTDSIDVTDPSYALSFATTDPTCAQVCDGTASVTTSSPHGPYAYYWYTAPQQTVQTATALCEGYATVTVTDTNNCALTDSVLITAPAPFALAIAQSPETCPGACDGLAAVTTASPYAPYIYSWSTVPPQATDTAANLCPGTYAVTVVDSLGCSSTDSVTVMPSGLTVSFSVSPITCTGGGCDGSVTASLNSTGPFVYVWSTGDSTANVTNLCPGNYTVDITDSAGCTVPGLVHLDSIQLPVIGFTTVPVQCAGVCDGQVTPAVTGNGPFTYAWSTSATTQSIDSLCPGWYALTVTDTLGCTAEDSVLLTPPAPLFVNVIAVGDVLCNGQCNGTIDIIAGGGTPPYSYAWSNGLITPSITALCGGSYTVVVTDTLGCEFQAAPIQVNDPPPVMLAMTPTPASCQGCNNGSIAVTVSGGVGGYSYTWTPPVADPDSLTAGWYFLCVNDSNGCQVCDSAYVDEPNGIAGLVPALVLAAHPNPFSDETTVRLPQAFAAGFLHVVLTDLRGRKVRETTAPPATVLHVGRDGLPPGLYLLTITDAGGRTARSRLMVQ